MPESTQIKVSVSSLPPIDLSSDEPVLEYVEGAVAPNGVPARDLSGGDLARIAYVELLAASDDQAKDFERPKATPSAAARVAARLIEGGAFRLVTTQHKPADPAPAREG